MRVIRLDGVEHRFPADFTDAEIEEALENRASPVVPAATSTSRASQADVRAADNATTPMSRQEASEAAFEANRKAWRQATGGALKPGQTENQAVAAWSAQQDPRETRSTSEVEHAAQTGELTHGDSVAANAAKGLAAIGGFISGGPAGATGAEAVVRMTSLFYNLHNAMKAGMEGDRAATIFVGELTKGVGTDAAFNFGVPLVMNLAAKVPGAKTLADKVKALIEKGAKKVAEGLPAAVPASAEELARTQAKQELGKRIKDDYVPTPGQETGEASAAEALARRASPVPFQRQERAMGEAAEQLRRDTVYPPDQPTAKGLGESVQTIAEETQRKVKERLRPVFEAADNLGVNVDPRAIVQRAQEALAKDRLVPGGRLAAQERADLEKLIADLNPRPGVYRKITPEGALDLVSRIKEKLRSVTADWKPSSYYSTVVGDIVKETNSAFAVAAGRAGRPDVVKNLLAAQKEYREMMETVYDDAVKTALKKNPEDIGRLFWQGGNVSEIEQLQRMLTIAEREGAATPEAAKKLMSDMARGFLQEAVRDVNGAATWSSQLASDPLRKRTWEALTRGPSGSELTKAMSVLENAAQIATRNSATLAGGELIPIKGAAAGAAGYALQTIRPGLVAGALSLTGLTRLLATAYTRGDKGAINAIAKVLVANGAGTAASAKALQALLPKLEELAQKYGAEDVFSTGEQ